MKHRKTLTTLWAVLILAAVLIAGTVSWTFGSAPAQIDPTSQQQTIDAVVAGRFTQTAVVQQQIGMTQTVQAATVEGPTQTAAFNATVDAAFNQALTATANPFLVLNAALPGLERISAANAGGIQAVGALPAAASHVTHTAFSPDSQRLAVVIEKSTLAVATLNTGAFSAIQQGYGEITSLVFSPDGSLLAFGSQDGNVRLWNLAANTIPTSYSVTPANTTPAAPPAALSLAFSPDGSLLAAGNSLGTLLVWTLATGEARSFDTQDQAANAVAFSPDGKWIAVGGNDATVQLWDAVQGARVRSFQGHTGPVLSVAFSPDGSQLASGSADGTVRLWNAASGDSLIALTIGSPADSVAFSPDGSLLAVGVDARAADQVILFDAAAGGDHAKLFAAAGEADGIKNVAFSPDGSLLAAAGAAVQLLGARAPGATVELVVTMTPLPPATLIPAETATLPPTVPAPNVAGTPLPPALALSATSQPQGFPTNVAAQVDVAEEAFQQGHMFWLRPNRQIWVMVNNPPDSSSGDWYCFNDTFQEGEPEIDPSLVPPANLYQPRRGFGKIWRSHPDLKTALGWATTPEFELVSSYTYIAGGYMQNGAYVAGPGEHRLTTLYGQTVSFFESQVRGDCLGGTWRMTK